MTQSTPPPSNHITTPEYDWPDFSSPVPTDDCTREQDIDWDMPTEESLIDMIYRGEWEERNAWKFPPDPDQRLPVDIGALNANILQQDPFMSSDQPSKQREFDNYHDLRKEEIELPENVVLHIFFHWMDSLRDATKEMHDVLDLLSLYPDPEMVFKNLSFSDEFRFSGMLRDISASSKQLQKSLADATLYIEQNYIPRMGQWAKRILFPPDNAPAALICIICKRESRNFICSKNCLAKYSGQFGDRPGTALPVNNPQSSHKSD